MQKVDYWNKHLTSWGKSKLSQAQYCRQNNLNPNMFSKWKRLLSAKNDQLLLTEVPVDKIINESSNSGIELIINESIKVRVVDNFNKELLQELLKSIGVIN
jgi:hypothetical protein